MKAKKFISALLTCCALSMVMSCGDDNDSPSETVKQPAPTVVSTTPANGATNVETGNVTISVNYDQAVTLVRSKVHLVNMSGGTVSTTEVSGKTLTVGVN